MRPTIPILFATAVVLLGGVVQGVWVDRWKTKHEPAEAAARLDRVALAVGDWTGRPSEFDVKEYAQAGIVGGLFRRYVNRRTGDAVTLLIVCGLPGPISVHTPEVCYAGAGYESTGPRDQTALPLGADQPPSAFWKVRMRKLRSIAPELLEIHYGWSTTGTWRAPERDPRFEFAGSPSLYKMYVVRQAPSTGASGEADPSLEFLRVLVPELRKSLFPTS
jgi:hypothetical protein